MRDRLRHPPRERLRLLGGVGVLGDDPVDDAVGEEVEGADALLLGQGTGGGALALMPADRVISAQHSWLSPLPPEGASAIVHRTTERAPEMARAQAVRALDLRELGIVDRIVAEKPDAADEPEAFCARVGAVLEYELAALLASGPGTPADRASRYR